MAEYLSKETLQEKLNRKKAGPATKRYTEGWNDAILMVKSMIHSEQAADVAPVQHGRWDENGRCSNCWGHAPFWCMASTYYKSPWCQECGAKMDLK